MLVLGALPSAMTNGSNTMGTPSMGTPSARQRPGIEALVERLTPTEHQAHLSSSGGVGVRSISSSSNNNNTTPGLSATTPQQLSTQ